MLRKQINRRRKNHVDKESENLNLFKKEKELKVLSNEEAIKNFDKRTGQLSFLSTNIKVEAVIREALEPITEELKAVKETNQNLSEKSERLVNTMERMIPHLENKMIGNEDEAFNVWCENPENADIARVNTSAPEEVVYCMISADLAKCFGTHSYYVSILLKDVGLWNDNKFSREFRTSKSGKARRFKKSIVNETYKRLEELYQTGKITLFSKRRQEIYFEIYDHMRFFRDNQGVIANEPQSDRPLQSLER